MSHLIKIYDVCKFSYIRSWYLKRYAEPTLLRDAIILPRMAGHCGRIAVLKRCDSNKLDEILMAVALYRTNLYDEHTDIVRHCKILGGRKDYMGILTTAMWQSCKFARLG